MRKACSSLGWVFGTVLPGVLVAAILILLGLAPVLGAVAGVVVTVDLYYYLSSSDGDHAGCQRGLGRLSK
jgi:hypothetical protein